MKSILAWIDERSGVSAAWQSLTQHRILGQPGWLRVWPAVIFFTVLMQCITGLFLWIYYTPTVQSAWESVYFVQYEVAGGWLLRAMHHYAAQVLLVLIGVYLIQMVVTRACKSPRELVFWVLLLMGMFTLALCLTGDLLSWDRNSYSATHVRVSFLNLLPVVGGDLFRVAIGGAGPAFGQLTLPRFLALHIGVFAAGMVALSVLHIFLRRRANRIDLAAAPESAVTTPIWPQQTMRSAVACVAVVAVVLIFSLMHGFGGDHAGVSLGSPADPLSKYAAARPEWAFLGLYKQADVFSKLFPNAWGGVPIFIIPGIVFGLLLIMPFLARSRTGHYVNIALLVLLVGGDVALSLLAVSDDARDPDHQAAVAAEQAKAQRVVQLIRHNDGVPPQGALSLLLADPKTRGPELFDTNCASCHNHAGEGPGGFRSEDASAPDLFAFASRQWVRGILDPEKVGGPEYFGNTAFARGDMVNFVRETFVDLADDEKEEVDKIAWALSAEARLKSQQKLDTDQAAAIAEGRELMDDWGCFDCHKFHDNGQLGDAPDLTGFGSREWIGGIVSDPTSDRFYRDTNDRMPSYAPPGDPANHLLSHEEIEVLTSWLRGEWYEP